MREERDEILQTKDTVKTKLAWWIFLQGVAGLSVNVCWWFSVEMILTPYSKCVIREGRGGGVVTEGQVRAEVCYNSQAVASYAEN